jgi:hypothetical protein
MPFIHDLPRQSSYVRGLILGQFTCWFFLSASYFFLLFHSRSRLCLQYWWYDVSRFFSPKLYFLVVPGENWPLEFVLVLSMDFRMFFIFSLSTCSFWQLCCFVLVSLVTDLNSHRSGPSFPGLDLPMVHVCASWWYGAIHPWNLWVFLLLFVLVCSQLWLHSLSILLVFERQKLGAKHYLVVLITLATIGLWCSLSSTRYILGQMGLIGLIPVFLFFASGILDKCRGSLLSGFYFVLWVGSSVLVCFFSRPFESANFPVESVAFNW